METNFRREKTKEFFVGPTRKKRKKKNPNLVILKLPEKSNPCTFAQHHPYQPPSYMLSHIILKFKINKTITYIT